MIGFSINLNNDKFNESFEYIKKMSVHNIPLVFGTFNLGNESTHDTGNDFNVDNLKKFAIFAKTKNIRVMLDVYPTVFEKIGYKQGVEGIKQLIEIGVTDFRLDWGFSLDETLEISKIANVVVNASTITFEEIDIMIKKGIKPAKILMSHNYYPKIGTALDRKWFNEKNLKLKQLGFPIQAWIPGDDLLEQPLYLRLPNIEPHRTVPTFNAYVEFKARTEIDMICIGDRTILEDTVQKIINFDKGIMILDYVKFDLSSNPKLESIVKTMLEGKHSTRPDMASSFIRDELSRHYVMQNKITIDPIPHNLNKSYKGLITMDNSNFGRYQGEIDIHLGEMFIDNQTNLIGKITNDSRELVDYLLPNMEFKFRLVIENDFSNSDNGLKVDLTNPSNWISKYRR